MMYQTTFLSPIGKVLLEASNEGLTSVRFAEQDEPVRGGNSNEVLEEACLQLRSYFAGQRLQFDLPLVLQGTPFQQQVWQQLGGIPFGATVSYHSLAEAYGDVKAIRAIAAANGKNNIAIVIPCHRVVGSNGALTGFAWGLDRKLWLLNHEAKVCGKPVQAALF